MIRRELGYLGRLAMASHCVHQKSLVDVASLQDADLLECVRK